MGERGRGWIGTTCSSISSWRSRSQTCLHPSRTLQTAVGIFLWLYISLTTPVFEWEGEEEEGRGSGEGGERGE